MNQKYLKSALTYDPLSGKFTWLLRPMEHFKTAHGYNTSNAKCFGKEAGTVNTRGYVMVGLDGSPHLASRLAWLYHYGEWPRGQIDHINRVRTDNRICNLRDVSPEINQRNKKICSINTSGITGVCWNIAKKKWVAKIGTNDGRIYLGTFGSLLDAACARKSAELRNGYYGKP